MAADLGTGEGGQGLVVIRRLHRLVRHGYRPWLGYDVASGQDRGIHLRRGDGVATLRSDGSVALPAAERPGVFRPPPGDAGADQAAVIAGDDDAGFDALFPPNAKNRRNIVRRLYEIGFLAR